MLCRELFSCCLFGERRTENGERRTENGERRTENGERRMENGEPATGNYSSTYFLGTLGDNPHKIS